MNKRQLISLVAEHIGYKKKEVEAIITSSIDHIISSLASNDEVSITNFGKFSVKNRAERIARNPKTGAAVKVSAKRVPTFTFATAVKQAVQ